MFFTLLAFWSFYGSKHIFFLVPEDSENLESFQRAKPYYLAESKFVKNKVLENTASETLSNTTKKNKCLG